MKSVSKSALALMLAAVIAIGSLPVAAAASSTDAVESGFKESGYAAASPLIVTEVVSTGPAKSRFTYTEIYNNSNTAIDFKDYHFYYRYPNGTGQNWTTGGKNVVIDSGKTLVLWQSDLKASSGLGNSVADFNKYYGVDLVENKDIFRISYAGIHATAKRGFLFGKDEDSIIAEAWCNESAADLPTNNPDKLGIQYSYSGSGRMSEKTGTAKATPGSVDASQVPSKRVHISTSPTDKPSVNEVSAPDSIQNDGFTVQASVSYPEGTTPGAMQVNLFYRQKDSGVAYPGTYSKAEMEPDTDGKYKVTVGRSQLWGSEAEYYVKASYGPTQFSASGVKTVSIHEPTNLSNDAAAPFIVTEVSPNPGGQYSYVEIYNRTDKDINLSYYKFFYYYDYPNKTAAQSGKTFTVDAPQIFIKPGKTMVLWLSSNGTTVDQFNQHYGCSLLENQDIVNIDYSGLHSTEPRWIRFGTTEDNAFTVAGFNENPSQLVADGSGKSLQFSYPRSDEGIAIPVTLSASTPGSVEAWQIPSGTIPFTGYKDYPADDGKEPTLQLSEDGIVPDSINEGEQLYVMYDVDYINDAASAERYAAIEKEQGTPLRPYLIGTTINYQLDGQGDWYQINQKTQWRLGKFVVQIPSDVFFGHDSVTYNVVAYTLYGKKQTENCTVKINRLNKTDGVRLNVKDGSVLSGTTTVTANNGAANTDTKIQIDGKETAGSPMLENGAYFSVQCSGLNNYFKNALTAAYQDNEHEIITYYSPWCEKLSSRVVRVDNKYFTHEDGKYKLKLTMWAGGSATPFTEIYPEVADENHEDYSVSGVQLRLTNGKNYLPVKIEPDNSKTNTGTALTTVHTIGDSAGMVPHMDIYFEIPDTEVNAVGAPVNTTALSDGSHTVTATSGGKTATAKVIVDNTAPKIDVGIEENSVQYKAFTLSPVITDSNKISQKSVKLDGREIETPAGIIPSDLSAGEHTIQVIAADEANNIATKELKFSTESTDPNALTASQGSITDTSAALSVNVGSNKCDVEFLQGKSLTLENGGVSVKGSSQEANSNGKLAVSAPNGNSPYELFTVNTGNAGDTDVIEAAWNGKASNSDSRHTNSLYVLNTFTKKWDKVGEEKDGAIKADFTAKNHTSGGKAVMLVQCLTNGTNPNLTADQSAVSASSNASVWDGTGAPQNYDFAFAWETDTQYYSESFPAHYSKMNQWIVDNRKNLNIRYVMHTGDIVDDVDMKPEWANADAAMKIFDDADMPYGILGGNHDVGAGALEYTNYWKYFGEDRFKDKSYYGGSYKNNLGHYDLLTENGQDLIVLYMSWDIYTDEINWMNQVLSQYSDRKAIICLHRYTNVQQADNLLDYTGKLLQKEVVAKNKNVIAVLNGHYHGASIQTDSFDDNNDGTPDRVVYQICTDYQSDPEGGSEYIKFLYFDLKNNKIYLNSYSPCRNDYNFFDTERLSSYGVGTKAINMDIAELDVDFNAKAKTLLTSSLTVNVQTQQAIGSQKGVTGTVQQDWIGLRSGTQYGWYARVTSDKGSVTCTPVMMFTTTSSGSNNHHNSGGSKTSNTPGTPASASTILTSTNSSNGVLAMVSTQPDTAPVVTGNRSAVNVTVPFDAASVISSATAERPAEIRVAAPTAAILSELKNSAVNAVDLTMQMPSSIANNTNANARVSINVEPAVLQAAKDAQKDLTLRVTDSQTGALAYSWTFSGSGLKNSAAPVSGLNLAVTVESAAKDAPAAAAAANNAADKKPAGLVLKFGSNGLLPAPATVKIHVGGQNGITPNSKVYFYYFNNTTNALEQLPQSEYTVDADGYVTLSITHCS
ncbi:MAG TPA: lamin tail domain-containing protein, partial [Caproiciproducens sp.]|nr:lamin tail domain-containing protein [Caproiciproducens sp.]